MAQDVNVNINVKGASDGGKKVDKLGSNLKKTKGDAESLGTSLSNAWGEVNILGTSLGSVSKAFKATAASGKLMFKSIKVGLISTGIGAFVVAIGSLATYFSQTKAGAELLETTLATLGAAIKVITDRIANFGGSIIKVFKGDFKGAAKDMKNALAGIGTEIKKEIKLANDLAKATINLRDSQRELNVETAKQRAEVEALKLIAEDQSKTEEVRLEAAQKAFAIEQELLDKRVANAEEAVRIQQEQMAMGENTAEDLDRLAELEINLFNIQQESGTKQIELNNKINAIKQETINKTKQEKAEELAKIKEVEAAERQSALDRMKTNQRFKDEILDRNLSAEEKETKALEQQAQKRRDLINEQFNAQQLSVERFETLHNEINDELVKGLEDIRQKFKDAEKAEAQAKQDLLDADIEYMLQTFKDGAQFVENHTAEQIQTFVAYHKKQRKLDAETAMLKDATIQSGLAATESVVAGISGLLKEGTKGAKAAAMAQILIDTAKGISSAIAGATAAAAGTGPAAVISQPLFLAQMIGTVLTGIANAKATLGKVPGGGGGGGGTPSVSAGGSPNRPTGQQFESMIPQQLTETIESEQQDQTIQAYVVENDISNAQALQEELETQATL
jgi:hypothetical protein